jgi:hypothetical protein
MQAKRLFIALLLTGSLMAIGSTLIFADGVFPDGTLVMHNMGPGNTTIFYIRNGRKEPIPNWSVFTRQGWNIQQVKNIPQQQLDNIPTGPTFIGNHEVVALPGPGGTTYEIENGQKRPIPDEATFAALGYSWNELVRLPPEQMDSIPTGPLFLIWLFHPSSTRTILALASLNFAKSGITTKGRSAKTTAVLVYVEDASV